MKKDILKSQPKFVVSYPKAEEIPLFGVPEAAFVGRSNVGKSSLLNAVAGVKGLARTSNTPGRTQMLNFFDWAGSLILVDLPGYGFAKASKADVKKWDQNMRDYLRGRVELNRVFLLIDSRRGVKKADEEMMDMLDEAAVVYQIVLTKIDKIKRRITKDFEPFFSIYSEAAEKYGIKPEKHGAMFGEVIVTSAEKGIGIEDVRGVISGLV